MTARLVPVKAHHDVLIPAFAQLVRQINDAELILIGDGPQREELQLLMQRLGIESAVHFSGHQDNSRVYEELAKADVYVHSSHEEGLPFAVLEAMAVGLPVVATRVGGVPEAVRDGVTGLLVPPGDVAAFSEAMVVLGKDPLLRMTMGSAGRRVTENEFDVRKQNVRCVDLLRKLIKA